MDTGCRFHEIILNRLLSPSPKVTASLNVVKMSVVIEQLPNATENQQETKDVEAVERLDDEVSWMELSFAEGDGADDAKSMLSFAEHAAITLSLGGSDDDDASLSSKEQEPLPKPSSSHTQMRRIRPKKTTMHTKSKSFDDTLLMGGHDNHNKKKKKKKKDKKKMKGDSEEFSTKSSKSKKSKKRSSNSAQNVLLCGDNQSEAFENDDSLGESLESLVSSAHSGASKKRGGKRRPFSLSPKRSSGGKNIVQRGAGMVQQLSFRAAKGLKDQLAMSDHKPRDRTGLMGQRLYTGFDDNSDSEDEFEF